MAAERVESAVTTTRYLNVVELIMINEEIIGKQSRVRDVDLLEAAVLRPMTSAFGEDAYPTVLDKAAALFHSLSRNHAFMDGNKRTSTVAMIVFLRLNGYQVTWDAAHALRFILEVSTGQHAVVSISAWLQANTRQMCR